MPLALEGSIFPSSIYFHQLSNIEQRVGKLGAFCRPSTGGLANADFADIYSSGKGQPFFCMPNAEKT
jgi:hypothetical protein